MTKIVTTIVALVMAQSVTQAAQQCSLLAENPNVSGQYDQFISQFDEELGLGSVKVLHTTESNMITVVKTSSGRLSIASFNPKTQQIFAMASGSMDDLSMIDGSNKIAVTCIKK